MLMLSGAREGACIRAPLLAYAITLIRVRSNAWFDVKTVAPSLGLHAKAKHYHLIGRYAVVQEVTDAAQMQPANTGDACTRDTHAHTRLAE
jgi:hypothetical protein